MDTRPEEEAAGNHRQAAEAGNHRQAVVAAGSRREAAEVGNRRREVAEGAAGTRREVAQSSDLQKVCRLNRQGGVIEDFVNEGLPLGIPQREQHSDEPHDANTEAGCHPVNELAHK